MNSSPLVYVLVLNYNGVQYLRECLSSFKGQTYSNYKIVVYDNASTDNSMAFLENNFPNVMILRSEKNIGFAKGNNLAIEFALKQKADYVFLLNNDTEIDKDLLEKLISRAESDASIGIVGPAVFDLSNKDSIQEIGMAIDRFGYPMAIKNFHERDLKVFFVSGCAMLIKSELLRKIGLFDETYFMFAEDLDLCWRTQLAGYKIAVNENAKIYHESGASISGGVAKTSNYRTNVKRIFLREKNTVRTLIKNYDTSDMIRTVTLYVGFLFFECVFWSIIIKPNTSKNILKAVFWNLKFFPDTFRERLLVQRVRRTRDRDISKKMVKGYCKLSIYRNVGVPDFSDS